MLETSMDLHLLHRAASAYYLDDRRQADIAGELGLSRPTVSKLLAEARRIGLVRFEVLDVDAADIPALEARVRDVLGIHEVRIAAGDQVQREFRGLGELLSHELRALALVPGDVLLVSSGQAIRATSLMRGMPQLPGVIVAPTVGGLQEPDHAFQTNELAGQLATSIGATARYIFAPALPSPSLWQSLQSDPSFQEITDLWDRAKAVVVGVGAPYQGRRSLTSVVPRGEESLAGAAGDICLHFFDDAGESLTFPGSDRLLRPSVETLRAIPTSIALAAGREKARSIRAGARSGLLNHLITDVPTAEEILAEAALER